MTEQTGSGTPATGPSRQRLLVLAVLMLVLLALGIWVSQRQQQGALADWSAAPANLQAVLWPEPRPLPAFTLVDQNGAPFVRDQLQGKWSLVFFGFLHCPDACPLGLHAMKQLRELMGREAEGYNFVFVTVDPARDQPTQIKAYLAYFDASFIGLSGEAAELEALAAAMAVRAVPVTDPDGRLIAIDHTTAVMVLDPAARLVASLPAPHHPELMRSRLRELLGYFAR